MKICILNSSGNVGKTTITREVFEPRMNNAKIVEIESYNSSNSAFGLDTVKFEGAEEFDIFYEYIISDDDVIFDIGASEIANFFTNAEEYTGAIDMFDYFIIPTIADAKIMEDTAKTILFLRSQEIDDEKIKVIFNSVERNVEKEFAALLNFDFNFDTNLFIKKSNFFKDLSLMKTTFLKVYNPDKKYYREILLREKEPKAKKALLKKDLVNMGAEKKIKELDSIFTGATGIEVDSLSSFSQAKKEKQKSVKKENHEDSEISEDDEEL